MKPLHRRPLLKKIALAGLSIGPVGSLVSCSASGGGSGKSDNATVDLLLLLMNLTMLAIPQV